MTNILTFSAELTANVAAICNLTWTPEVISAYQAQQAANRI